VPVRIQLPLDAQVGLDAILALPMRAANNQLVPLSALVQVEHGVIDKPLYTKDLKGVSYVFGDMAGKLDSPLYGLFGIRSTMRTSADPAAKIQTEAMGEYWIKQPSDTYRQYALKWDGESQITYETFRDMGAAYGVGLILIYLLVVAQFKSYLTPLVIMAPIPLTIIGVMPGHALLGAQYTATSMIGMIALAGIIVRNSILLVDFIELQVREGVDFKTAVLQSAIVRAQPIGRHDRRLLHSGRPDLQRAGHFPDLRHSGVHPAHAGGDTRPVLRAVPASYGVARRRGPSLNLKTLKNQETKPWPIS
jgi:multidrug efflux pump subunit AcrB